MTMKVLQYKKTIAAALLLIAGVGGVYLWRASSDSAPAYREVRVTRGDIELSVLATGVVQPRNRLEIKPPIAGRVDEVLADEGQHVRKGQVLAWMSSSERAALLDAARAKGADELRRWEELYRATPVIAPLDGTLILRNAEPGQTFAATDAVFVMSDRLTVRASVDETDIAQVKLHQRASVTLDAYPETTLSGAVDQIAFDSKTVNNVTTYEVSVLPQKVPAFMRSGMTVNVSFDVRTKRDVLVVPAEAVLTRERETYVLMPAGERAAPREQPVQVGLSDGRRSEVLAGLADGDVVLVSGPLKLGKTNDRSSPLTPFRRR